MKENRTVRCGCIKQEEAKKRRWCSISLKTTENMIEPAIILKALNGVIQSDGYQAYANIKDIKKTWDVLLILEENW